MVELGAPERAAAPTTGSMDGVMNIEWDKKFEVGHERIDFEHQIFLSLIGDLSKEIDSYNSPVRRLRILKEIRLYAEFHFVSEENIMEDHRYPDLPAHHTAHQYLLSQLNDKIYAATREVESPEEILQFLFEWFALHTTQEDKKLVGFLKNDDGSVKGQP